MRNNWCEQRQIQCKGYFKRGGQSLSRHVLGWATPRSFFSHYCCYRDRAGSVESEEGNNSIWSCASGGDFHLSCHLLTNRSALRYLLGELQCLTHCFLWKAPRLKRDWHCSTGQRRSRLFFNHLRNWSQDEDKNKRTVATSWEEEKKRGHWDPQACKTKTCHSWDCFQVIVEWEETELLLFFLPNNPPPQCHSLFFSYWHLLV